MLGPVVKGRLNPEEFKLGQFLEELQRTDLDNLLALDGVQIAQNHRKAEGEVSITVVQRTTEARSGKEKDKTVVARAQVRINKLHMTNVGKEKHVDQLIVADQGIMREEFMEGGEGPAAHLRFDLSKYAHAGGRSVLTIPFPRYVGLDKGPFGLIPGTVAVRYERRMGGATAKVWVATYDVAALYFVFDPVDRLHSIFIYEKKRSKKEFGVIAEELRTAITLANKTPTDRALAGNPSPSSFGLRQRLISLRSGRTPPARDRVHQGHSRAPYIAPASPGPRPHGAHLWELDGALVLPSTTAGGQHLPPRGPPCLHGEQQPSPGALPRCHGGH